MARLTFRSGLTLLLAGLLLSSCAPGHNDLVHTAGSHGTVAGFWLGLWHGLIVCVTFILSLFMDHVSPYEAHNNGGWYNFGFLLGCCISLGGSGRGMRFKRRARKQPQGQGQTPKGVAEEFLAQRRLALVGLSRQPADFSRGLFRELVRRGYDMVPVNPAVAEVEGRRCYARVQDIAPQVDGVILMTPPAQTEAAVRDCLEAGIKRVWMHRGAGQGAVSQAALALCRENNLQVVAGECPYMYLPDAGAIHRLHALFRRREETHPVTASVKIEVHTA